MFMVEDDNIAFKISIIDAFASYKILHYPFKVIIFFSKPHSVWWIISKDSERIN